MLPENFCLFVSGQREQQSFLLVIVLFISELPDACQAAFESKLLTKTQFAVYVDLMMHLKVQKFRVYSELNLFATKF